ncbi:MAG: hypothetical protein ACI4JN_03800 [Ruminococcus sp.]
MVKLLKNEWKRYRLLSIIILIAAAGLAGLLMLSAAMLPYYDEDMKELAGYGSVMMLCMVLSVLPYIGVIYCILSYVTDIGRKGMIFLTPVQTWKIILSKLIYGLGLCTALAVIGNAGFILASSICQMTGEKGLFGDITDILTLNLFSIGEDSIGEEKSMAVYAVTSFVKHIVTVLHTSLIVMGSISLARFSANSVGVQVLLSIVYYYAVSLIEKLSVTLVLYLFTGDDDSFFTAMMSAYGYGNLVILIAVNVVFSAALYAICVCLTDKKVNLVS